MTTVNINTYTDADYIQSFQYQTAEGDPIDLTGESLRMQVRQRAEDATALFECSTINGLINMTDAATGAFTVMIPIATLEFLDVGTYVHSLIRTDIELFRRTIWRGSLTHAAGPTRWDLGTQ